MEDNLERPRLVKAHVDAKLYADVTRLARENDRPIAREVRRALESHVARHQKAGDAP